MKAIRFLNRCFRAVRLLGLAAIFTVAVCPAFADYIPTLFNTGEGTNSPVTMTSPGLTDAHWSLVLSPSTGATTLPAYVSLHSNPVGTAWLGGGMLSSQWISPIANAYTAFMVGQYAYQTTFDLTGFDLATVAISGSLAVDNYVSAIYINGVDVGFHNFGNLISMTSFTLPDGDYVLGTNTLEIAVYNGIGGSINPTGLRVEFTAPDAAVPEPSTWAGLISALAGMGLIVHRKRTTPVSQ